MGTKAAAELDALRVKYLGKKGELTAVLKQMGSLSAEERPIMGQMANEVRAALESAIESAGKKLEAAALEARLKAEAQEIAGKLENCPVKLSAKAGNGGKLFGAVTTKEISEGLKTQYGVDIPKQKLVLDEPIKAYGSYQVKAKLGFEVSGTVYVTVCEEK